MSSKISNEKSLCSMINMIDTKSAIFNGARMFNVISKPLLNNHIYRPKYGAVNFDVIDAVNARLAAASGTTDLFSKLRIETSFDNEKKIGDVEV